jgi:site-specific DNA-methyltransferase (adenine-specific)
MAVKAANHASGQLPLSRALAGVAENALYYGDNLDVLRRHIANESVDLVYLDPPFNSNASYNVLFVERGTRSAAQIHAFTDTWRWDEAAAFDYQTTVEQGGRVADALRAFRTFLGTSDMLAYLSMMAPRLVELRRVMKATASLYLHCDPTASHYLKLLLDAVFGPPNFRSEIIWKRYGAHNDAKGYGAVHDVILFYSQSRDMVFNKRYQPYDQAYVRERFRFADPDGRQWSEQNLASPNPRPNLTYAFTASNGITYQPPRNGWKYTLDRMVQLDASGRLHYPQKANGRLRQKNYLDEMEGVPVQDVWTDVGSIGGTSPERLGYQTQKPISLLERIIEASSNQGEVVLDPFCGCGTTIEAAQRLDRRWIGIDITHLAIALIKQRLVDAYGLPVIRTYRVIGEPTDLAGATDLAISDPFQFQAWALGLVGARIAGSDKKGPDKGIDGRLYFHDEGPAGRTKQIVLSVKSGHTGAAHVDQLRGVVAKEGAEIGALISLQKPTRPMRETAASAGFYVSQGIDARCPRLQLLTIEGLLSGRERLEYPSSGQTNVTLKRARRAKVLPAAVQLPLTVETIAPAARKRTSRSA